MEQYQIGLIAVGAVFLILIIYFVTKKGPKVPGAGDGGDGGGGGGGGGDGGGGGGGDNKTNDLIKGQDKTRLSLNWAISHKQYKKQPIGLDACRAGCQADIACKTMVAPIDAHVGYACTYYNDIIDPTKDIITENANDGPGFSVVDYRLA